MGAEAIHLHIEGGMSTNTIQVSIKQIPAFLVVIAVASSFQVPRASADEKPDVRRFVDVSTAALMRYQKSLRRTVLTDLKYDVRKTTSLVNPYIGVLEFVQWASDDGKTIPPASARAGVFIRHRLVLSYSRGKWSVSSGLVSYYILGELKNTSRSDGTSFEKHFRFVQDPEALRREQAAAAMARELEVKRRQEQERMREEMRQKARVETLQRENAKRAKARRDARYEAEKKIDGLYWEVVDVEADVKPELVVTKFNHFLGSSFSAEVCLRAARKFARASNAHEECAKAIEEFLTDYPDLPGYTKAEWAKKRTKALKGMAWFRSREIHLKEFDDLIPQKLRSGGDASIAIDRLGSHVYAQQFENVVARSGWLLVDIGKAEAELNLLLGGGYERSGASPEVVARLRRFLENGKKEKAKSTIAFVRRAAKPEHHMAVKIAMWAERLIPARGIDVPIPEDGVTTSVKGQSIYGNSDPAAKHMLGQAMLELQDNPSSKRGHALLRAIVASYPGTLEAEKASRSLLELR